MNYSINPKLNAVMKTIELQLLSKRDGQARGPSDY